MGANQGLKADRVVGQPSYAGSQGRRLALQGLPRLGQQDQQGQLSENLPQIEKENFQP